MMVTSGGLAGRRARHAPMRHGDSGHLLALTSKREVDVPRQPALSRYYLDAGVGGLAVGVQATQFAIRETGLHEPVLRLAIETAADWSKRPTVLIGGIAGGTTRAPARGRYSLEVLAITPVRLAWQ